MSISVTSADTARHLRRRAIKAAAQGAGRARRLRARLPVAVACLRRDYGAATVILFGSLANRTFGPDSDVDLAVSGLGREAYFKALADLMDVFEGPVDLVRLEDAPASLRERIDAEGERL
jgi:predicted nucleotidyltransferase